MSDRPGAGDPMERFRELVTEWERGFDALANRVMGTDEFSRTMNQFQNLQLTMQKAFAENMARNLAAVNVPSRDDVLRLGEAVHELERRLARMGQQLDEIAAAVGVNTPRPRKGPPRTKQPPSARGAAPDPAARADAKGGGAPARKTAGAPPKKKTAKASSGSSGGGASGKSSSDSGSPPRDSKEQS